MEQFQNNLGQKEREWFKNRNGNGLTKCISYISASLITLG